MNRIIKKLSCFVLCLAVIFSFAACDSETTTDTDESPTYVTPEVQADEQGIRVVESFAIKSDSEDETSGAYSDVAGILVYNGTDKTLQYAEIYATFSDGAVYSYKVTTLPPGEYCQVAEDNMQNFRETGTGFFGYEIRNVAFFAQEPSVYSDRFQFSGADGILNIKNISDSDITEDIIVYYKDYEDSMLSSGVTYRVTVSGGLASGEIKQVVANHYKHDGSIVMFVQMAASEVS